MSYFRDLLVEYYLLNNSEIKVTGGCFMHVVSMNPTLHKARQTMEILRGWRLGVEQVCFVLGLPETRLRKLNRLGQDQPLPDDPDIQRRASYVRRIAEALHTSYPTNPTIGARWLRQKHRRLGQEPLRLILEQGEDGLEQVLAELDCTFCWELNSPELN